jgi:UDP-N-acetylglucosamine:LPS N-acetylglucosamine transferase
MHENETVPAIELIYFDAGGGHRAAANALSAVISQQQRPWNVRLVNLQELLDPLDVFRKVTRIRLQDLYNQMLAKGLTLGASQALKFVHAVIRLYHRPAARLLAEHWRRTQPDLVVSVVPNLNRAMFAGLRAANPATPFVTILTDLADYPPHFWIEQQEQYFICGTEKAVEQARALGHPPERIFPVSGMILRPIFYQPVRADRQEERKRLGLDAELATGLVMFGGQGSRVMADIVRSLGNSELAIQLIVICGKNEELAARLRGLSTRNRVFVEGFTSDIPYYMHLSDFFIGKPGPGSISEAMAMHLPVIIERNAWTLPQERYNADWVLEKGVGLVLPSFRDVEDAVHRLLEPPLWEKCRAGAAAIHNSACFEIPDILARLLTMAAC